MIELLPGSLAAMTPSMKPPQCSLQASESFTISWDRDTRPLDPKNSLQELNEIAEPSTANLSLPLAS